MLIWKGSYYAASLLIVFLYYKILLFPLFLFRQLRRRHSGLPIELVEYSLYFAPAMTIILIGVLPSKPHYLNLASDSIQWILLFLFALYLGLSRIKKADSNDRISVLQWVQQWPGWFGKDAQEPKSDASGKNLLHLLALPGFTLLLSLTETVNKVAGFFQASVALPITQILLVSGSMGLAVHVLMATDHQSHPIVGRTTVLRYPRIVRAACLLSAILVLLFWSISAGYELPSDLQIVASKLPNPHERIAFITLVNRSNEVRVIKEFHVESLTTIPFICKSADFDIPIVAQYELEFHIGNPLTVVDANPVKQFPSNTPGSISLAFKPNAIGACSFSWETNVRLSVVTDDDRRSKTSWFRLKKNANSVSPP